MDVLGLVIYFADPLGHCMEIERVASTTSWPVDTR